MVTQARSGNCFACVRAALPSWRFCVSGAISTALEDFFLSYIFALIFALIGTLLINKWKFLHLKSGGITDPSKLLNPQEPEGRFAKSAGGDLVVLMKLNWFPFVNFRDTLVAGRADVMLKRECELEGGVFPTCVYCEVELSNFKCSAIINWVNSWERMWPFQAYK